MEGMKTETWKLKTKPQFILIKTEQLWKPFGEANGFGHLKEANNMKI